jgi:hypothetical protein
VKEIHGYNAGLGIKVLKPDAIGAAADRPETR